MSKRDIRGKESDPLEVQLRVALRERDPDRGKVHGLVCALVDRMKDEGAAPERVLIAVKVAVLGESLAQLAPNADRPTGREKVLAQTLSWCIERYFAQTDAG